MTEVKKHCVAEIGYFRGTFAHDWLGIPANGREINIRLGELRRTINKR